MENFDINKEKEFYKVPQGYHETLRQDILNKTIGEDTNVKSLWPTKWLAAASVILVLGLGTFYVKNYTNTLNETEMAKKILETDQVMVVNELELEDLTEHVQLSDDELKEIIKK